MGDVVNLRQARKARVRAAAEAVAHANRVRFGRTRAEREAAVARLAKLDAVLDGARLDEAADPA